ncbi:CDP-diacylglycerol-glycerol-3-phosphate 3-phosphatidyltransferas-like protein [Lepidopterella palustris CBS 459.81]|uniref:CDP-diacylglycerol--glycerol-3-phosphate 3-phosphatidyltransferase n=1 Tax=Lepidopterella palustris CBS 459.81 TaxID=1314670 RepID=A0A8E2JGI5_9PEZI|nr:CDP-diacylglycerol-glycerol-3-phosphate 3-phosphatidyltransferas-like protein [Lepidopterella palustris CBS 459.81]
MPSSTPPSNAQFLGAISSDLDLISPRFEVQPSQIQILRTPSEFYETLKAKISKAQHRIYLSTLYIGKTEHELISTIREALQRNPNLQVAFLTDALRGTRETPEPSCASLLVPLVAEFGPRVEIRMFHTPNLTGLWKKLMPRRINEGWGLQHMKLYGVDDELIISGANLSNDYFTNRQDRYHVFSSAELTSYFQKVHSAISQLSFLILPSSEPAGYTMTWPARNPTSSPLTSPANFKKAATTLLAPLLTPTPSPPRPPDPSLPLTTVIYPLLQLTPLLTRDTSTELPALTNLLRTLSAPLFRGASWTFTAGYFNMTPSFRRLLLSTKPRCGTVIAASPYANGFYGSAGVSGMLPSAYTLLARHFLNAVRYANLASSIQLKEWRRGTVGEEGGWSYHAKGLWVTLPGEDKPSVTLVGSSNYTKRSYELDIEANVVIVTRDEGLKKRLGEEEAWLQEYAGVVGIEEFQKPERRVGVGVRLAMWAVKVLGGAL